MTETVLTMVRIFHEKFGFTVRYVPTIPPPDETKLRLNLTGEEYEELVLAVEAEDIVKIADALGDLVYTIYGFALHCGINLDQVVKLIHQSNMTKTSPGGGDTKALKGPDYVPPDITGLLGIKEMSDR